MSIEQGYFEEGLARKVEEANAAHRRELLERVKSLLSGASAR
jgi:hypothetical protein